MLEVVERFVSINGEGAHAGELAAFIRFKGCNLCCSYCDTSWANEPDAKASQTSVEELVRWVKAVNVRNVTLTGGEPLLQKGIDFLANALLSENLNVEFETNGSIAIEKFCALRPDYSARKGILRFTLDYKLPGSGMEDYMMFSNYDYLKPEDAVKFVVGGTEDLIRAKEIIDTYRLCDKCKVFLSPVFEKIQPSEIVNFMLENKMNGVRLQLQLHKVIWDPNKRGV
jgi:7-carboxy-7-deazaguanine synthase